MNKALLAVAACAAVMASGQAAAAVIVPYGPQNDVSVATVQSWGWIQCYSATYAAPLGSDASAALTGCQGDYLMLAAKLVGSDTYEVLAAAAWDDVLFDTGNNTDVTHTANGAEWYYHSDRSWGFAGLGDAVQKTTCDTAGVGERDRLCWHTHPSVGGYRAGAHAGLNGSMAWEKIILVADAIAVDVPEPATLALLGSGLFGIGVARRRKRA